MNVLDKEEEIIVIQIQNVQILKEVLHVLVILDFLVVEMFVLVISSFFSFLFFKY